MAIPVLRAAILPAAQPQWIQYHQSFFLVLLQPASTRLAFPFRDSCARHSRASTDHNLWVQGSPRVRHARYAAVSLARHTMLRVVRFTAPNLVCTLDNVHLRANVSLARDTNLRHGAQRAWFNRGWTELHSRACCLRPDRELPFGPRRAAARAWSPIKAFDASFCTWLSIRNSRANVTLRGSAERVDPGPSPMPSPAILQSSGMSILYPGLTGGTPVSECRRNRQKSLRSITPVPRTTVAGIFRNRCRMQKFGWVLLIAHQHFFQQPSAAGSPLHLTLVDVPARTRAAPPNPRMPTCALLTLLFAGKNGIPTLP